MNILSLLIPKKDVCFLTSGETIAQGLDTLRATRYSSVPLLDEEGYYVGTITAGDLLWHLEKYGFENAKTQQIKKVSRTRDYSPVGVLAPIDDLIKTSLGQNFIPILDDRNFFIGIVTRKDLIAKFIEKEKEEKIITDNEVLNALFKRRSIRRFKQGEVNEEVLTKILSVTNISPTAGNRKPMHTLLLSEPEEISVISKLHVRGGQFTKAPYVIIVLNDDNIESNSFLANNNCSGLIVSLLLAIDSYEELGGCWISGANSEQNILIKKELNIPEHFSIYGYIIFGHKDEFKPANEVTNSTNLHRNKW